jgi:sialate O-acetylesterase
MDCLGGPMKSFSRILCYAVIGSLALTAIFTLEMLAAVQLSRLFTSGMVVQRDTKVHVWGTASAGDTITVSFLGPNAVTIADTNGNWSIILPAKAAGGPYAMAISTRTQTITLTDVYIGDVWLASGQSNMEMQVNWPIDSAGSIIAAANYQTIRQFKIPKGLANDPSEDLPNGSAWTPATSAYVGSFSAVGYLFAKELHQDLGIPVGIINSSYGGSRIETWMSEEMLGYDEGDTVLASGQAERQPTVAFNKMIHPLRRFPVKGFLWYQGESNADNMEDAVAYGRIFKTMIAGWRGLWGLGDIPFLWVQLPNYGEVFSTPQTWDAWPRLRAGQTSALVLPNTGEAVTIDVGSTDIHPTNKIPVARRLALVTRKVAYGEDIEYQGPRYRRNHLRDDGKIEIQFDHTANGLAAKDSLSGGVGGFAVAGSDNNLVWAQGVIDNGRVLVWNNSVPEPLIVRYAWEYNPAHANLYNSANLPAAPFLADVNPGFKITRFQAGRSTIERGQSTTLTWNVFGASSITLDGSPVDSAATINVSPAVTTTYTLLAINREDGSDADTAKVTVEVLDPDSINRTLNRPVTASTYSAYSGDSLFARFAVDGNLGTRWSSAWQQSDPNRDPNPEDEWIAVNFSDIIDIERMSLLWSTSYGSEYDVEVSYDGFLWNKVLEIRDGNGGVDSIVFAKKPAGRYLRIHGIKSATGQGYSLYEMAAYGRVSSKAPPVVTVNTNLGNVLAAGTSVTITASTTDSDGKVVRADFYVDNVFLSSDTSAPFEAAWVAGTSRGENKITAVVTDDSSLSVQSAPLTIYVDDGSITRFEAETASYTGTVNVVSLPSRSGGRYLQMRSGWVITFDNIMVPNSGDYLLTFCYQLTYESPKTQYLIVNGELLASVEFTAPSTSAWLQKGVLVPLRAGINQIVIDGYWEWMSLDYIGVRGSTAVSVETKTQVPATFALEQNYPNPFNPATTIRYSVPSPTGRDGHLPVVRNVRLDVYDLLGREVAVLVNEKKEPGNYEVQFDGSGLSSGVYFYRMKAGDFVETKRLLLIR